MILFSWFKGISLMMQLSFYYVTDKQTLFFNHLNFSPPKKKNFKGSKNLLWKLLSHCGYSVNLNKSHTAWGVLVPSFWKQTLSGLVDYYHLELSVFLQGTCYPYTHYGDDSKVAGSLSWKANLTLVNSNIWRDQCDLKGLQWCLSFI